jgi:hypothetical protein
MLKFFVAGLYSVGLLMLGKFVKGLIGMFRGESAISKFELIENAAIRS